MLVIAQFAHCYFTPLILKQKIDMGVYITMTSFAYILKEAERVAKMSADFSNEFIGQVVAKEQPTTIGAPSTQPAQGEQKIPVAKPNGVTR